MGICLKHKKVKLEPLFSIFTDQLICKLFDAAIQHQVYHLNFPVNDVLQWTMHSGVRVSHTLLPEGLNRNSGFHKC